MRRVNATIILGLMAATMAIGCGDSSDVIADSRTPEQVTIQTFQALGRGDDSAFCKGLSPAGEKSVMGFMLGGRARADTFDCPGFVKFTQAEVAESGLANYRNVAVAQSKTFGKAATVLLAESGMTVSLFDQGEGWRIKSIFSGGERLPAKTEGGPLPTLPAKKCEADSFPEVCQIAASVLGKITISAIATDDGGVSFSWTLPFKVAGRAAHATALKQSAALVRKTFAAGSPVYVDSAAYEVGQGPFDGAPQFATSVDAKDVTGDPLDAIKVIQGGQPG